MKTICKALTLLGILLTGICTFAQSTDGENPKVNYAINLSQKITDNKRMVADLQTAGKSQLPVGIPANVGGFPVVVCVDSAKLTPRGVLFSAYACIDFPHLKSIHTKQTRDRFKNCDENEILLSYFQAPSSLLSTMISPV
jgi:hypothetical protein